MGVLVEKELTTLLARQGIYDDKLNIYAYELLFRGQNPLMAEVNNQQIDEGHRATSTVISNLFANLNLADVVGDNLVFINFTRQNLLDGTPLLLPPQQIVIEVLEDMLVDADLIQLIGDLKRQGYRIALDDFIYAPAWQPLVELADIIKIDVLNQDCNQIATTVAPIKDFKGLLLAEKIETKSQFHDCLELGFSLFQGYFLNRPDPVQGQVMTENKSNLLRLMAKLYDPKIRNEQIEDIILQEPKLSYRILKITNSASSYKIKKIDSIQDAIMHLGIIQIRNWVNLLMLSSLDNVPEDTITRTLIRAKMCESLAQKDRQADPVQAYTVGMLSLLDAMLNKPLDALLKPIPLSEPIKNALIHFHGPLGLILKRTIEYEMAQFDLLQQDDQAHPDLVLAYLAGVHYAESVLNLMK